MQQPHSIIISRVDSIGDVVLTLPVAKVLNDYFPEAKIIFLGRDYTRAVIESCRHVDAFLDEKDFLQKSVSEQKSTADVILHVFPKPSIAAKAKALKIGTRIGTKSRLYHWFYCNKLVNLSRKNSNLHEAQLNLKLLRGLNIDCQPSLAEMHDWCGLSNIPALPEKFHALIEPSKFNLILHPKSQGSAREWSIQNFIRLINLLPPEKVKIFVSGTRVERPFLEPLFDAAADKITDISGEMNLSEFMAFIHACDGLLAASTGPLHIAGALGKHAFGLYPPMRPIHAGRWAPIGKNVHIFSAKKTCNDCKKNPEICHCMNDIKPEEVAKKILEIIT